MNLRYTYYEAPIGSLLLAGNHSGLSLLGFPRGKMARRHEPNWVEDADCFVEVKDQLALYFSGQLDKFSVALSPAGTNFQQQVWQALQQIPYGDTWSYSQLANYINKPKAARAVGAANGVNPIPIIIPCHRVIGSSGKLTGFSGGLETKEFLLDLESKRMSPRLGL